MRAFRVSVLIAAAAILGMAAWTNAARRGVTTITDDSGTSTSALTAAGQAGSSSSPDSLTRAFSAGGQITMDLSAGEYRIEGTPDDRIEIRWSLRDSGRLKDVRVRADVKAAEAKITTDGPSDNFRVAILVPSRSHLRVRLSAGELSLRGVEGHKDIELRAGELDIDIGRVESYRQADGNVWAGEIEAPPFRVAKSGLFRSFDWRGSGTYRLHTRLMAGELRLRESSLAPVER
jgi:hypothetical protein